MSSDVEHLFMCLLAMCMSSLKKVYSGSLPIFLIVLFVLLMLSCMSYLYFLDINPLSDVLFVNIFCHSVGSLFILLIVFFIRQSFLV